MFLQYPQELGLQVQRHVSHLVEEQCALVGPLEAADALGQGAGKGPFLVAEQIALSEAGGNGGAVHLHHLLFAAGAQPMDGLGDQLLAGAGFPQDQHGAIALGHQFHLLQHALHGGALIDDAGKIGVGLELRHPDRLLAGTIGVGDLLLRLHVVHGNGGAGRHLLQQGDVDVGKEVRIRVGEDQDTQQVAPIAQRQYAGAVRIGRQYLGAEAAARIATVALLPIDEEGLVMAERPLQTVLLETGVVDDARLIALLLIDQIAFEAVGGGVVLRQTQAADGEVVLQYGEEAPRQLGDAHQFNHRIGDIHQDLAAVALQTQGIGLLQGALLVEHVFERNGDDGRQLGQLGQGLHRKGIHRRADELHPAQMAAGRGDGQLAVRVQPLIHSGRRQQLAAVVKAGHGQHYGLLPGEIEIGLGADQVLGAPLSHEVEEGLLPRPQIEGQVDPGHTTKTGVNPVQLLDEIIQGDGGEQVLGEGEKAVIPDGGDVG